MKFKDKTGKEVPEVVVLNKFFGLKPNQPADEFMREVKALSPEDKTELAVGAAKELGYGLE